MLDVLACERMHSMPGLKLTWKGNMRGSSTADCEKSSSKTGIPMPNMLCFVRRQCRGHDRVEPDMRKIALKRTAFSTPSINAGLSGTLQDADQSQLRRCGGLAARGLCLPKRPKAFHRRSR